MPDQPGEKQGESVSGAERSKSSERSAAETNSIDRTASRPKSAPVTGRISDLSRADRNTEITYLLASTAGEASRRERSPVVRSTSNELHG